MRHKKARTFEQFFSSVKGHTAWMRGMAMYKSMLENGPIDDGYYSVGLDSVSFKIPPDGFPCVVFVYRMIGVNYPDRIVTKMIAVDTPVGIMSLLQEYRKFLPIDDEDSVPQSARLIEMVNGVLNHGRPRCNITIATNRVGVQSIQVSEVFWDGVKPEIKPESPVFNPVPADQFTGKAEENGVLEDNNAPFEGKRNPEHEEAKPEPKEETESADEVDIDEVDIAVGMHVKYRVPDYPDDRTGLIQRIYEEDQEVIILDDQSKARVLVPGSALRGILATS